MDPDKPTKDNTDAPKDDSAANVIRAKLDSLYADEPEAKEEILDAQEAGRHRSKHQAYMYEISTTGKSLAEIQTAWHEYYVGLSDKEKHEVWQEFYAMHDKSPHVGTSNKNTPPEAAPKAHTSARHKTTKKRATDLRSVADVKEHLLGKVSANGKLSKKHHIQSLVFGISMGAIVMLFLTFGFFNERFIAPFITPSRSVSSTPIIIDPSTSTGAVGPEPKIIIPKINVEIPVVYGQTSINEDDVQRSLENGVVHYANTAQPGQNGNAVLLGHSSSNLFNNGKYKFAFVLLRRMEVGDTFTLNKDGKQYVYRVSEKKIVSPNDVSVLADTGRPMVTLITCDPPGTSVNRLIVVGEQISPDPATNTASTVATTENTQPAIVPGNAPSLWHRLVSWISS